MNVSLFSMVKQCPSYRIRSGWLNFGPVEVWLAMVRASREPMNTGEFYSELPILIVRQNTGPVYGVGLRYESTFKSRHQGGTRKDERKFLDFVEFRRTNGWQTRTEEIESAHPQTRSIDKSWEIRNQRKIRPEVATHTRQNKPNQTQTDRLRLRKETLGKGRSNFSVDSGRFCFSTSGLDLLPSIFAQGQLCSF